MRPAKSGGDPARPGPRRRLRTEQATERAIKAQEARDRRYAAVEALALELARALDSAAERQDPYATAQLCKPYLEVLRELRMTPKSAPPSSTDGSLDALLAALSTPTVRDPA